MAHEVNLYPVESDSAVEIAGLMHPLRDAACLISQVSSLQSLHIFISSVSQELKVLKEPRAFAPVYSAKIWTNYKSTYSGFAWILKGKMEIA